MEGRLELTHYDLITPDGVIVDMRHIDERNMEVTLFIENISPSFVGFQIDKERIFFNLKSTLAQLGVDGKGIEYDIDKSRRCAQAKVKLIAIGTTAQLMLKHILVGSKIGKLFAADDRRIVRDAFYLSRMFGRSDRWGDPLLSLGGMHGSNDLILDKVDGRTVAYLSLQNGRFLYGSSIAGFIPTIAKILPTDLSVRKMLRLHQEWHPNAPRNTEGDEILLVRTLPLHIRTVFGRVVDNLLSEGYKHTSASILEPHTKGSGDIYELYGESKREISDIPVEFYTLEPYREYVYYSDRDQLQTCIENPQTLFNAFKTAPEPKKEHASVFVVKGEQLLNLTTRDWLSHETRMQDFPGLAHGHRQAVMIQRYIEQQPSYPFLKAIVDDCITSQGILITRYFPSPLMKRMLLGDRVQSKLKGIYFQYPSQSFQDFFSAEDRSLLHDLYKFAIPVYWVDEKTQSILQYIEKENRENGLFVPLDRVDAFYKSTVLGIYGSNLIQGNFEIELKKLLQGILKLKSTLSHPLMNPATPLSLVTGGGPGTMEVGNRIARELGILSCANILDFRLKDALLNEQKQNPYIEAKMTYRLDKLVERQSEFNLDLPIFLIGGIGTDFEYSLEEVRRKVGTTPPNPIILFGNSDYWTAKVTPRYQSNLKSGTIKGSEWVSNCFYCIASAEEGLEVYHRFFTGELQIGPGGPSYDEGFAIVKKYF